MMEQYRQGKTPDFSTSVIGESYQQSYLVAKQEKLAKDVINFALQSIYFIL
jgi:uncharacterized protein YcsI (UPF0317 family)